MSRDPHLYRYYVNKWLKMKRWQHFIAAVVANEKKAQPSSRPTRTCGRLKMHDLKMTDKPLTQYRGLENDGQECEGLCYNCCITFVTLKMFMLFLHISSFKKYH